jgi:c-di-AMP phosphodiesterase-like protein
MYDENNKVLWANKYADKIFKLHLKGHFIKEINGELDELLRVNKDFTIQLDVRTYEAIVHPDDKVIYFFDQTELTELNKKYEDEATVLGIIALDNYEEAVANIDEHSKSEITSKISQLISNWAVSNNVFIRKYTNSSYMIVMNEKRLNILKDNQFKILDEVRQLSDNFNISLTLSMGLANGDKSVVNLGHIAKTALDLALIRGGDQVAIKSKDGKTIFYGGKTDAMEKRNRVRARVISQSIETLISESSNVLVMGHKNPDYDSIGASIGMYKISKHLNKKAHIVFDDEISEMSVKKLMTELSHHHIIEAFVEESEAVELIEPNTLLIVVDNHKPSLVNSKEVLEKANNIVIIDHHRRGDEFIESPMLTYLEPYASSTCELVTELMEYQHSRINLSVIEATAMLGGIMVDTKHFTFRTGTRTFDAAAYLKTYGADSLLVQELLKEDINSYFDKVGILKNTEVYNEMAIAISNDVDVYDNVVLAKVADQLLSFDHIKASFVIGKIGNDEIGVSARSLGDVNVQVIMEALGGGGHLTNAATQIKDQTIIRTKELLKEKLDELILAGDEEDESNIS